MQSRSLPTRDAHPWDIGVKGIVYPVKPCADGTDRIIDASGRVIGTLDCCDAMNEQRHEPPASLTREQAIERLGRLLGDGAQERDLIAHLLRTAIG